MRYNKIGVNVDSIDKLILDIYNYAEKINKTLNQITNVVEQTKSFYECEAANNYRKNFNNFKTNFNLINKNIQSYAEDFIKLKNKYRDIDMNITNDVLNEIRKMQNQIK